MINAEIIYFITIISFFTGLFTGILVCFIGVKRNYWGKK